MIKLSDVCPPPQKEYYTILPVASFNDSLTVTIRISTAKLAAENKEINFSASEVIADETPIFRITKQMGLSVSVGRIIENDLKFYIYKVHLFRKVNGCWEDASWDNNWSKFSLGEVSGGYAYGNEGTSGYIGFSGSISIE